MALPTQQQEHIEAWQASGLTQVAYCRQHKLNSKTFSNWLHICRSQQVAPAAPTLIPVEIIISIKSGTRLSSGSYFPPPVRAKRIPKGGGKDRILGIPTVSDRIAQGAVKLYAEVYLDPIFHEDSYGYRPRKSAH